jgi:sodium transport system ATP-binding protein
MIQTTGLTKIFSSRRKGRTVAVDRLDLRCADGEIYALLGPNGAGKTTTLRILSTLMEPSAGDAFINNLSVRRDQDEIRKLIGVVSFETGVYERMTPREIGRYFGRINDLSETEIDRNLEYIFDLLRMRDFADQRTDDFSSGMKQKTVIMRALVTSPEILIFDEPTSGLDLLTAKSVVDYIRLLKEQGKTILFSTHVLWEAEKLADRIGIIHNGALVEEGPLEELRARTGKADLEDIFFSLVGA